MRPFDKRVLDVNRKFLSSNFEELVEMTKGTIIKRRDNLGLDFKMSKKKKSRFKKLK